MKCQFIDSRHSHPLLPQPVWTMRSNFLQSVRVTTVPLWSGSVADKSRTPTHQMRNTRKRRHTPDRPRKCFLLPSGSTLRWAPRWAPSTVQRWALKWVRRDPAPRWVLDRYLRWRVLRWRVLRWRVLRWRVLNLQQKSVQVCTFYCLQLSTVLS